MQFQCILPELSPGTGALISKIIAKSNARSVVRPQGPLSLLGSFAGAGALASLFHAMTIRHGYWNGGWGGKAGLCAFAGCWVYRGFGNAFDFLRNKRK